ncbi:signal transduction histidine kinase [Catenuloplanes nepalensis]|uniref:Signal transduction histidine kinase n=1 Tax=Catenuloplanes nepalensis TaxID=587533 RepID=A0ABT9MPZ9_9ACTN|nr:sensor histidine kinase [Catenuloplanes nepalensis]MDP9793496.1 signal transduction histidine kinase [Catenuloplanes nepalensis]
MRRWVWPWDVFLLTALAVVMAVTARHQEVSPAARAVSVTALALAAAVWILWGRRIAPRDDEGVPDGSVWFGVVLVVLFVVAVSAAEISTFALFGIAPMPFLCMRVRPAVITAAVLNLTPLPVDLAKQAGWEELLIDAGVAVLGLTFSTLIGTTIERISEESRERARLIEELEASRARVAALSHDAGVAAERARLAAEIHDTLAQGFTSIVTLVQAIESELSTDRAAADRHLALVLRTARENLAEARAMVTVLAPAELHGRSLAEVLSRLAAAHQATCSVDAADFPTATEVVIVRTVQEALTNVRRHAHATTVTVDLIGSRLTISDDGVGFAQQQSTGGYGLRGMRARAEQIGADLTVTSAPGAGTTITLDVPS